MDPNSDVLPLVSADESVEQGIAPPDVDQGQQSDSTSDKDYNFRAVVSDRDRYREEAETLKRQMQEKENLVNMYKSMSPQTQPQAQGHDQPQQSFGLNFEGAVDEEALNKLSGLFSQKANEFENAYKRQSQEVEKLQLQLKDPNYMNTIEKYLPNIVKQDPLLAEKIRSSSNPMQEAYYHATHNFDYFKDTFQNTQSVEAERMVNNALKPKTLGSIGTQTNVGGRKDAFSMTDEEFEAAKTAIRNGTFKY